MKEQYVADVSDYRKYALLRALSAEGNHKIGVCWMLTPDDRGPDGMMLEYLSQPEQFRQHDPGLFDHLRTVVDDHPNRSLEAIEQAKLIAEAKYFNSVLPDDKNGRLAYWTDCEKQFADCDLVFFDPDNGMEGSLPRGRKNSSKFLYLDETIPFFQAGKSLLIYQHFPRVKRDAFIESCRQRLTSSLAAVDVWAYRTKHVVFLLVINPKHLANLSPRAMEVARDFDPGFVEGYRLNNTESAT
ncbi:hypothetical protein [Pyruvatibacter sp.]|uniref:hypothetical protein n=1 Tax=Pyruvatibacter sp. TaxID=1981328 RepID=UPI0032EF5D89